MYEPYQQAEVRTVCLVLRPDARRREAGHGEGATSRPCALWQDTDFGRDVMAGVYAQLKAMNVALVAEAAHKPTDTDFTASVARMRDAKCDFLFVASIVRDTNLIVSVARKGGWNVTDDGAGIDLRRERGRGARQRQRGLPRDDASAIRLPRRPTPGDPGLRKGLQGAVRARAELGGRDSATRRRICWRKGSSGPART